MTTTLYQDKDWKGKSLAIMRNYRSLKDTTLGNNPSSVIMSADADAIVMFNKEDWKGGVMYFRGVRRMESLGKLSQGGELFKGNSVTSVRVTPFGLDLNVNIVTSNGRMPGGAADADAVENDFGKAVLLANSFFAGQKAMIELSVACFTCRENPKKFDLKKAETGHFPGAWKNPGEVDIVLCNTLADAYGQAKMPWWGKVVIVEMQDRSIAQIARTLAHELGHYLGLSHKTGDGQADNIMSPSDLGLSIEDTVLLPDQIEEMQTKLARNLTRKGDRN